MEWSRDFYCLIPFMTPVPPECLCCDPIPVDIVITYPCEIVPELVATKFVAASGCFYTDGSGDPFTRRTENYNCGGTSTDVHFDKVGVEGPVTSASAPACPSEVRTGPDVSSCTLTGTTYHNAFVGDVFGTADPGTISSPSFGAGTAAVSYTVTYDGNGNILTAVRGVMQVAVDTSGLTNPQTITYSVQYDYNLVGGGTSTVPVSSGIEVPLTPGGGAEEVIGEFTSPPYLADSLDGTTTVTIEQCTP
jgi:hypothetical protein